MCVCVSVCARTLGIVTHPDNDGEERSAGGGQVNVRVQQVLMQVWMGQQGQLRQHRRHLEVHIVRLEEREERNERFEAPTTFYKTFKITTSAYIISHTELVSEHM